MGLALSTAWNSFKCNSGREIIHEIKKLGFEEVELNFNLTSSMINDILALVEESFIKISSIHNFCPVPEGVPRKLALPDCYSISSLDEKERQRAIHYTKLSIDTAHHLKAKAVVLHCGRVELPDPTRRLLELYRQDKKESSGYKRLIGLMKKQREKYSKPFLENALRSLELLDKYAKKRNVFLGIENRFYFFEIPSFEEVEIILNNFSGSNIFYWHDTGHAQIHENLGLVKHRDFLSIYSEYMGGIHLHDVKGVSDHRAPLKGEIDFNMFYPYLKPETIKVMEAHSPSTEDEIINAKRYLESIFNGKL